MKFKFELKTSFVTGDLSQRRNNQSWGDGSAGEVIAEQSLYPQHLYKAEHSGVSVIPAWCGWT